MKITKNTSQNQMLSLLQPIDLGLILKTVGALKTRKFMECDVTLNNYNASFRLNFIKVTRSRCLLNLCGALQKRCSLKIPPKINRCLRKKKIKKFLW